MVTNTASDFPGNAPRLLDQVHGKIHLKRYNLRTGQTYVDWIKRFIRHFGKRHPRELGAAAMNVEHLVTMANQIAANFEAWPDHGAACNEVANHLKRFWDPRMRRQIVEHVTNGGGAGLSSLALAAVKKL